MLKFWRRIRRKLINEGNLKRYSFYAIGEILLVVIGILIALQINNWNENRKSTITQRKSLLNLKLDIQFDVANYKFLDSTYHSWIDHYEYLIDTVLAGNMDKLTSPDQYTIGRGSMYFVTLKKTTYDEMLNTGSYYQIKNEALRKNISEYYEVANFETTKVNADNKNLNDYFLSPAMKGQKNIVFRLLEKRNLDHIDWSWLSQPNSEEYKELENRAIWFKYAIIENRTVVNQLQDQAKKLIEQIENELN